MIRVANKQDYFLRIVIYHHICQHFVLVAVKYMVVERSLGRRLDMSSCFQQIDHSGLLVSPRKVFLNKIFTHLKY